MSVVLRVVLIVLTVCFLLEVFGLISKGRLQLKYSLLWLFLALVLLICAVFPGVATALAHALGFQLTSNMVFFIGIVGLVGICLSLTVIVSWQARDIRRLLQEVALMRKELDERDKDLDGR